MNFYIKISSIALLMAFVTFANASDIEDKQLGKMYEKMKGASGGVAMNLDSSFGGGRCNCVCKNNN